MRWSVLAPVFLGTLFVVVIATACGNTGSGATQPSAAGVATKTPVPPTVLAATTVVSATTAPTVPAVTGTTVVSASTAPTVVATATVAATAAVTGTAAITGTATVTGTAAITGTTTVTGTAAITGTAIVTGTAAVTRTATITGTAAVVATEVGPGAAPAAAAAGGVVQHAPANVRVVADTPERAGMYIVGWLGNCNDCHSPGWGTRPYEGRIPVDNWAMGGEKNVSAFGVSYSANLRLVPGTKTVDEFIGWFRTRQNPRMPWDYFRDLNSEDLTAVYKFMQSLGPKGEAATAYATSTPGPTTDPKASVTPTVNAATPSATKVPATLTPVVPTATPRPDLLAPDARPTAPPEAYVKADTPELAGEYIVWMGRCNSCHAADAKGVANWSPTMPKDDWLMGGRRHAGNYGTVFSGNLRLVPQKYPTVAEFVKMMKTRITNPPMPWFAVHQFNEKDLTSVYAFLKNLGPKGTPVPDPVPPQTATPAATVAP